METMIRRRFLTAWMSLAALALWPMAAQATPIPMTLCVIGDSLAAGLNGWSSKLPANQWNVTTTGHPGSTVNNWRPGGAFYAEALGCSLGHETAAINLGSNDRSPFWNIPAFPQTFFSMRAVLDGLTPFFNNMVLFSIEPYVGVYGLLCDSFGNVKCLDQAGLLAAEHYSDPGPYTGTHPNDAGKQILASAFLSIIAEPPTVALMGLAVAVLGFQRRKQALLHLVFQPVKHISVSERKIVHLTMGLSRLRA